MENESPVETLKLANSWIELHGHVVNDIVYAWKQMQDASAAFIDSPDSEALVLLQQKWRQVAVIALAGAEAPPMGIDRFDNPMRECWAAHRARAQAMGNLPTDLAEAIPVVEAAAEHGTVGIDKMNQANQALAQILSNVEGEN